MQKSERRGAGGARMWVPVVLVAGVVAGILLSALPTSQTLPPGHGHGWGFRFTTPEDADVILSTVSIALLVALLVVYLRIYRETKAGFSLGLAAVFFTLLLESVLTSPLVYGAFGQTSDGLGTFLLIADVLKIAAFTALLYLSLG